MSAPSTSAPGQTAEGPLSQYLAARRAVIDTRRGDGGVDVCAHLTSELDQAIAALYRAGGSPPLAVVAVGGYGRREMCIYSDVDVMLLHDGSLDATVVPKILYPLWDAKLAVGHSVRSIREALAAAKAQIETLSALLTARVVAGDERLLRQFQREFAGLLASERRRLSAALAEEELERRTLEPYHLLATDLKTGRGGLRTFQSLEWERRRDALLGREPRLPSKAETKARGALLAARNALHAVAGQPLDSYEPEVRSAAADWLGVDVADLGRSIYRAVRVGESLADDRWADLEDAVRPDPVAIAGRWLVRALRTKRVPAEATPPPLELAVSAAEHRRGRPFSRAEERLIESAPPPEWTENDRSLLIRLLSSGPRGHRAAERLDHLGFFGRAIPHWTHVVAGPQTSPLHLHPVDTHLWRTVHELLAITSDDSEEPWCREVADELGSIDDVLLAALLHDIGKGLPGDHSEVGADLADEIGEHIGLPAASRNLISSAVRHHLLLPSTATRRDLGDRAVITDLASTVGDQRMLQHLYLLSVADARATGPAVWNDWKSSLVRTAFLRTSEELGGRRRGGSSRADAIDAVVEASSNRLDAAAVRGHVELMPDGYLYRFEASEVAIHVAAAQEAVDRRSVHLTATDSETTTTVTVASVDRPGMLALIAGVLALHNLSVLDAHISTRSDGVAIDSISVVDALSKQTPPAERWPSVRADLEAALDGTLDLELLLREKLRAYADKSEAGPVDVSVHGHGANLIVEVRCDDRIGLLHDLANALHTLGHDLDLARVDTRAQRVVDVFYVRHGDDLPATAVPELQRVLIEAAAPPIDRT